MVQCCCGRRLEQWAACMECACEVWWAVLWGLGGVFWRSYGRVLKSAAVKGQVFVLFTECLLPDL